MAIKYYNPNVFPVWLAVTDSVDDINESFTSPDGAAFGRNEYADAVTCEMVRKDTGRYYVGVVLYKDIKPSTIAHESFHAAHYIMQCIGEDFPIGGAAESWAYLIGWIAQCVSEFMDERGTK